MSKSKIAWFMNQCILPQKVVKKILMASLVLAKVSVATPPPLTDAQQTICVARNQQQIILVVQANPTTGFMWRVVDYDRRWIDHVSHQYQRPTTSLIGAPGIDIFRFHLKELNQSIQSSIQLRLQRPWETAGDKRDVVFHWLYPCEPSLAKLEPTK